MNDIITKSTRDIAALVEKREISCEELARLHLEAKERYDAVLGSYVSSFPDDEVLALARESDARRARGEARSPLDGMPVAVKDNMHARGIPTTCASTILRGYLPPFDATAVARLKAGGAIVIGKTNLDEFAMGSTCENSSVRITRNPWDTNRVPGGSSGGSAAAVSAGMAALALGSDTGGSIRQPAAFCGIVGLKPTYGLVSRYGLVAYASSLDQIGPLARDAYGCALMLGAISGHDLHDSTSLDAPVKDYVSGLDRGIAGMRIAVLPELFQEGISPLVREQFEHSLSVLTGLGAVVEQASMPSIHYAIATYYFIACAEAASNLSRYDGVKYGYRSDSQHDYQEMLSSTRSRGFGREVKKRILLGNFVLSSGYYDEYYRKALKTRAYIRDDMMKILAAHDAIAMPATPDIAYPLGESEDDPMKIYLADVTTVIANLAGLPALSVPSGMVHGMPVGLQVVGRPLDEERLLRIAAAFETARGAVFTPPVEKALGNGTASGPVASSTREEGTGRPASSVYTPSFIKTISHSYMAREAKHAERALCSDLPGLVGRHAVIAGWVHRKKSLGGIEFYELRDRTGFTQLVLEGGALDERIGPETVVQATGLVTKEERSPFGNIELKVDDLAILGTADPGLPVPLNRPLSNVSMPAILDNRTVSIRNPDALRAFRVQSEIVRLFGDYLRKNSFTEIKTPKIISSGTEGGTNIFKVNYFGRTAFLAQSPQFYKQIMVGSGLERVFEVGPVFRAEHHDTIRHLNEYISMDFEMGFIRDEQDIIDMQEGLLRSMMDELKKSAGRYMDDGGASLTMPGRIPRIHYLEALEIIGAAGGRLEEGDISPEGEKILCSYFEKEAGSQFVYVVGYPVKKRAHVHHAGRARARVHPQLRPALTAASR